MCFAAVCVAGDRRGQEHSGEEVYSNSVRVFDTGWYYLHGVLSYCNNLI